jgi:hypothetical protein
MSLPIVHDNQLLTAKGLCRPETTDLLLLTDDSFHVELRDFNPYYQGTNTKPSRRIRE